jgi:adenine-specific DNA-methyltransferase
VCRDPLGNSDCLVLSRIGQRRNDELEASLAGRSWEDLTHSQLPACANERASFMSTFEFTKQIEHPYASWSPAHKHFLPTQLRFPGYTAMCIPYWWMLREGAEEISEQLDLPYSTDAEGSVNDVIGDTSWVQTAENQRLMLDTFFSAVKPERSLCFFYVKRMPLTDDANRVFRPREANEGSTEDPRKLALWGELPDGEQRTLTTDEKRAPWLVPAGTRIFRIQDVEGTGERFGITFRGTEYWPRKNRRWRGDETQFLRLRRAERLSVTERDGLGFKFYVVEDSPAIEFTNVWDDTAGNVPNMIYVVQTNAKIIQRCLLMATDPGDLVLDPTCGSGTTATVAEQWGRRWITIDTSRVALALARSRVMGARYPFYLLVDSRDGQLKEAEITRSAPSEQPVQGNVRHGFVYERVPHITLKSIANNAEIDVIWDEWQTKLEPLRGELNDALKESWQEWEIPREAEAGWSDAAKQLHADWWEARIARQQEIDASIAAKAEFEYLYDKPFVDTKIVRVAGPFTVESLSPHRVLGVNENDELMDPLDEEYADTQAFDQMILENLKTAGVQQAHKDDRITFTALTPWPGDLICAEGRYLEEEGAAGVEKRAAIFIGPEFGTVTRPDLVEAAKEAGDGDFDVVIACAFNYEAFATEFDKLGRIPVLKARMNADLHMAEDLKNTGKGNLFVVFGEPDIELIDEGDDQLRVKVKGVDVFKPQTGEVVSDSADGIACWFIDTDYNEESFFVRQAYFLGANDPYGALKTTLKTEIDAEAWATLNSDTSRPFDRPKSGRIAVKVINHLGDEVMKVFRT